MINVRLDLMYVVWKWIVTLMFVIIIVNQ